MPNILVSNPKELPKYQVGVLSYDFDTSNNNVRLFVDKNERNITLWEKAELIMPTSNIPFSDLIETALNFKFESDTDYLRILNYNYCIITDGTNYYFYFITSTNQKAGKIATLNLKLDIMQNYYYDCEFPLSNILQVHLDRWLKVSTDIYKFNNKIDSPLFSNNLPNLPKYLKTRNKITYEIDKTNNQNILNTALNSIVGWVYIYLNPKTKIKDKTNELEHFLIKRQGMELPYKVLCAPIYPFLKQPIEPPYYRFYLDSYKEGDTSTMWDAEQLMKIVNDDTPNVLNIRISPRPPFETDKYSLNTDYEIYDIPFGGKAIVLKPLSDLTNPLWNGKSVTATLDSKKAMGYLLKYQPLTSLLCNIKLNLIPQKAKIHIISGKGLNSIDLEPHLFSQNCIEFYLTDYNGNNSLYDVQKIGNDSIDIIIDDNFNVDINKHYIRYQGDDNSLYKKASAYNFNLGLNSTNNIGLIYDIDQLKAFLAQNPNFQQIQQNQRDFKWQKLGWQYIIETFAVIAGAFLAPVTGGASIALAGAGSAAILGSTIGQGVGTYMENDLSLKQQNLTLDNMRNAPDTIVNSNTSYLYSLLSDIKKESLSFYYEIHSATEQDLKKTFWNLFINGYPYNVIDNIKNYDSTRKVFNYIKADVQIIKGKISNNVKTMIKSILSNGVRFWHQDEINYNVANYEIYLDKE